MISPLYTLVQNLDFSKKVNNSMKNNARATNNISNNRCLFVLITYGIKF